MKTEAKKPEANFATTTHTWVYVGVRRGVKKPLVDVYAPADAIAPDGSLDSEKLRVFAADRARRIVGGRYEVEVDTAGGVFLQRARFEGSHPDASAVVTWKAESDAILAAERAAAAERRAKADGDALVALKPLRKLWARSVGYDRLALEAVVLSYLRTGRGA